MTDANYTAIMLLIDRSGSMHLIKSDAEGGVNSFVANQAKADGRRTIRIAQFDHDYSLIHGSTSAKDVPKFQLTPRGNTALLDAMGRAITEFGEELAALPEDERPATVILAIMTDGKENWSQEYSWDAIKTMVTHQEENYGWQVLYLGANQDAIATGHRIGVRTDRSMSYTASSIGTQSVLDSMDTYVAAAAAGGQAAFTAPLRTVVRHQMKVLRAEVAQREAEMMAEAGVRIMDRFRNEDSKADDLRRDIAKLTEEVNEKLRKVVAKHEKLFEGGKWDRVGHFNSPSVYRKYEDRDQLRRALAAGIKAQAKTARTKLERQEADLLRSLALDALETEAARAFLDQLPTVTDLMSLPEIEAHVDAVGENALH